MEDTSLLGPISQPNKGERKKSIIPSSLAKGKKKVVVSSSDEEEKETQGDQEGTQEEEEIIQATQIIREDEKIGEEIIDETTRVVDLVVTVLELPPLKETTLNP